jgi:predicted glycogen debranching enzyme
MRMEVSETTDLDRLFRLEWIETNGLGGYAASTVGGAHTRRYHGLLVAATHPPEGRMVLLSRLDETVVSGGERIELGCNRFPGAVHPEGHRRLRGFERDLFPVFEHAAGATRLRKTIAAIHGENTTVVQYEVLEADGPVTLELRPFVAARDHHALQRANPFVDARADFAGGVLRLPSYDGVPDVFVQATGALFEAGADWWRSYEYDRERERGLEFREDLFTHGVLARTLRKGDRFAVVISTADPAGRDGKRLLDAERKRRLGLLDGLPASDAAGRALRLAADQFVVRRDGDLRTVVAGYPWFADWGRDAMIALSGLCLATGRLDDAKRILTAFARSVRDGMLPNRFTEAGEPEYAAIDASLWLFVAAHRYLEASRDEVFVLRELLPVLEEIVARHEGGTRHGIRVDEDGLLQGGEPGVALTWMDARVNGAPVTPRAGKPVEVNALWYNALAILQGLRKLAGDKQGAKLLAARVATVRARFEETFWNESRGCLYDVVDGERRDGAIRPNQLIALALPFSPLPKDKAARILDVVEKHLLTPVGLRSLAPGEAGYHARYEGNPAQRDGAYHQGTVWSWLLGPYATAVARVRGAAGRKQARAAVERLLPQLEDAAVGTLSEIFDAEPPHEARGAFAQAWSVAEALRVWTEEAGTKPSARKTVAPTRTPKAASGATKAARPRAARKSAEP